MDENGRTVQLWLGAPTRLLRSDPSVARLPYRARFRWRFRHVSVASSVVAIANISHNVIVTVPLSGVAASERAERRCTSSDACHASPISSPSPFGQ
jgi:hypothetical protein